MAKMGRKLNIVLEDIGQFSIASDSECQFYLSSQVATAPSLNPSPECWGGGQVWVSAANQRAAWGDVSQ